MKKAQGISINTIIIAAIALIVLVVLIAVFTGRMGIFGQDLTKVQEGTLCIDKPDAVEKITGTDCSTLGEGWSRAFHNFAPCSAKQQDGCLDTGEICCIKG